MNGICKSSIASSLVVAAVVFAFRVGRSDAPEFLPSGIKSESTGVDESVGKTAAPKRRSPKEDAAAHGLHWEGTEEAGDSRNRSAVHLAVPPAVRLSDDFRLPAALMGAAAISCNNREGASSPQVQDASRRLADAFYREVSDELAREGGWEKDVERNPESGEDTAVVKPGNGTNRIRSSIDERYRALYGADAFNAAMVASAKERMLPVAGQSPAD